MKKIIVSIILLLFFVSLGQAQNKQVIKSLINKYEKGVELSKNQLEQITPFLENAKIIKQNHPYKPDGTKANLLTEDFSDGALPAGWTNVDALGTNIWQFNNPGGRTINTSTNANGFVILDSDKYGNDGRPEQSRLTTRAIDCSGKTTVFLKFEHYFYSGYRGSAEVLVSGDNGVSWTSLESWSASSTANAATASYDITAIAAGQSEVLIQWYWQGDYSWYWAVDDIVVYEPSATPVYNISPVSKDFGTVNLGESSLAQTFTISNTGGGTLTVSSASIIGTNAGDFSISNAPAFPQSLTFGQSFTLDVTFSPLDDGARSASLRLVADAKVDNDAALTGTGHDVTITPPFTETFAAYPPTNWTEGQGTLAAPSTITGTTSAWTQDDYRNDLADPNGKSAKINIYGTTESDNEWLFSPPIYLGDGSQHYQLEFDLALTEYAFSGTPNPPAGSDDKFAVIISTDGGTTWSSANSLQTWDNTTSPSFSEIPIAGQHITISLSSYTGIVKIGFYGESTVSNGDNDLFVDNVQIRDPLSPIGEPTYAEQGGYALKFNGTSDYVNIPYSSNFDVGASNFTIEAWVKRSVLNVRHNILERNALDKVITLYVGDDNKIYATTYGGSVSSTGIVSNQTVGTNWTHIAFVRSGTTHNLYVNGTLDNTLVGTLRNFNVEAPFNIGRWPGGGFYFNGMLDEIKIWNIARSEADIKANMFKENNTAFRLKAYYKMSDGLGTTLSDNSGYNGDGSLVGNPLWKTSGAFAGSKNALDFDGVDDFVLIPDNSSLDVTKMTIEMWINWQGSGIQFPIAKALGQMEIHTTSTLGLRFIPTSAVYLDTDANVFETNCWYHIAFVYDPSTSTGKCYINGIEKQLTLANGSLTTPISNSTSPIYLGRRGDNTYKFAGKIDEVRIWNSARTVAEIRENMFRTLTGKETSLAAYYRMDYNNGITLYDITANANNGTLTNMDAASDWVVSNVFNTWIGSENTDWTNSANWSSGSVPSATDNVGIYKLNLANETTISGTPTVNHLFFSSTAAPTLSSNFNVNGNLLIEKNIDLNGKTITLGSTGYLSEGSYRLFGATGTIQTTRELNNINENIAGLGIKITEDGNLGNTTIIRGHESKGSNAIQRYYQITTANSPTSADMLFYYNDNELNGITEANLKLFKSVDGSTWGVESSSSVNTTDNTISLLGLNSFSYWAAGDGNSPLPVELTSFTAASTGSVTAVVLNWTTATEVNNYGFEVERSENLRGFQNLGGLDNWETIGFVEGNGNSNSPKEYSFTDKMLNLNLNLNLTYRLKQIDNNGKFTYSDVVEVEFNNIPTEFALYQNYPNPFNPSTTIKYALPMDSKVTLVVYNIVGQKVTTLINNESVKAGYHQVNFNANELATGIYIYRLTANDFTSTKKFVLMK